MFIKSAIWHYFDFKKGELFTMRCICTYIFMICCITLPIFLTVRLVNQAAFELGGPQHFVAWEHIKHRDQMKAFSHTPWAILCEPFNTFENIWSPDVLNTVWCHYNTVNFLANIHKRHPIAHPLGQGMGCLLLIQHLIDILPQFLQSLMQYHTILDHITMAPDCMLRHVKVFTNVPSPHLNCRQKFYWNSFAVKLKSNMT